MHEFLAQAGPRQRIMVDIPVCGPPFPRRSPSASVQKSDSPIAER